MVDVALHHGAANVLALGSSTEQQQDGNGGIYFEQAETPGGAREFAFWKREVREYLAGTMDTWLGEYNCDGVRIDSAHSMLDFVRMVTGRVKGVTAIDSSSRGALPRVEASRTSEPASAGSSGGDVERSRR